MSTKDLLKLFLPRSRAFWSLAPNSAKWLGQQRLLLWIQGPEPESNPELCHGILGVGGRWVGEGGRGRRDEEGHRHRLELPLTPLSWRGPHQGIAPRKIASSSCHTALHGPKLVTATTKHAEVCSPPGGIGKGRDGPPSRLHFSLRRRHSVCTISYCIVSRSPRRASLRRTGRIGYHARVACPGIRSSRSAREASASETHTAASRRVQLPAVPSQQARRETLTHQHSCTSSCLSAEVGRARGRGRGRGPPLPWCSSRGAVLAIVRVVLQTERGVGW